VVGDELYKNNSHMHLCATLSLATVVAFSIVQWFVKFISLRFRVCVCVGNCIVQYQYHHCCSYVKWEILFIYAAQYCIRMVVLYSASILNTVSIPRPTSKYLIAI